MVTVAKRVGGPLPFMGLLVGGGIVLGITADKVASLARGQKKARQAEGSAATKKKATYVVETRAESDGGLVLEEGDEFSVLGADGDAVLIERLGDDNNPYVISGKLLASISAYPSGYAPA